MPKRARDIGFQDLLATIGGNLHRLRREAGLTQAALAEDLDVAVEHLRGVEGGYRRPSLHLLHRAAGRLRVDVSAFFQQGQAPARNPGRPRRG